MKIKFKYCTVAMILAISQTFAGVESKPNQLHAPSDRQAYGGQLNIGGFYGYSGKLNSSSSSYGQIDLFLPLLQSTRHLFFMDLRGMGSANSSSEYNAGFGMRVLSKDYKNLFGLYGFYDARISAHNNLFQQLTLGAEYKRGSWSLGGNAYLPLGTKKYVVSKTPVAEHINNQIFYGFQKTHEVALTGFDFEAGYTMGNTGITTYLGGYYFTADNIAHDVAGPRGTLNLNLVDTFNIDTDNLNRLDIETSVQYDQVRGTSVYAGVRLSIGFGGNKNMQQGMMQHMTDFVRRDLDIVTIDSLPDTVLDKQLKNSNNVIYTTAATNKDNLTDGYINETETILYLTEDISFDQGQSIEIQNAIISGGTFSFESEGYKYHVTLNSSAPTAGYKLIMSAAQTTQLIHIETNAVTELHNMQIIDSGASNGAALDDPIIISENSEGVTRADSIKFDDLIIIGNVRLDAENSISVKNSNFTISGRDDQWRGVEIGANSTPNSVVYNNNTTTHDVSGNDADYLHESLYVKASANTTATISNNTFVKTNDSPKSHDTVVYINMAGDTNKMVFTNNSMSVASNTTTYAHGLYLVATDTSNHTRRTYDFTNNTVIMKSSVTGTGIFAYNIDSHTDDFLELNINEFKLYLKSTNSFTWPRVHNGNVVTTGTTTTYVLED